MLTAKYDFINYGFRSVKFFSPQRVWPILVYDARAHVWKYVRLNGVIRNFVGLLCCNSKCCSFIATTSCDMMLFLFIHAKWSICTKHINFSRIANVDASFNLYILYSYIFYILFYLKNLIYCFCCCCCCLSPLFRLRRGSIHSLRRAFFK